MTTLTAERNTPRREGDLREGPVAAAVRIFAGAIVMRDAAGNLTRGATALDCTGVGRAEATADNSGGAAGAITVRFRPGVYRYANSAAAEAVARADIGAVCWIVNDQTVARTSGTGTRSRAGIVEDVDAQGVWVRFDEALTRAS